jgi:hypothetical protein
MKNYSKEFKPSKYAQKFMQLYCLTYNIKASANKFLTIVQKNKIYSVDAIQALQSFNCFRLNKIFYFLLSKLTFGQIRREYKDKYNQLKDFLNQEIRYKY